MGRACPGPPPRPEADRLRRQPSTIDSDVNALGLRTQITEAVRQPDTTLHTDLVEYEYDLLGRLTSEKRTRGAQVLVDKEYSYDLVGNRVQVINSGTPQDATFNALHQLLTDGNLSFAYDASGNLYEKKQGATVLARYEYDFLDRLSKVTNNPGHPTEEFWQTYEYDAGGALRRTDTSAATVKRYVNDHQNVTGFHQALVELDGGTTVLATMTYGLDLVKMSRGGEYYYIYDPLGSTRALTDDGADVTDTYLYDAYGNLVDRDPDTGFTENPYLFTGERLDPGTGFYYLRARFYDPATGRFTQLDTYLGSPQDPPSLHRYLYANANPANFVDPGGHAVLVDHTMAMAMVATLAAFTAVVMIPALQDADISINISVSDWTLRQTQAYSAIEMDMLRLPVMKLKQHTNDHGDEVNINRGWKRPDRRRAYAAACNAIYTGVVAKSVQVAERTADYVAYRMPFSQANQFLQRYLPTEWANKGIRAVQQSPQIQYVEIRVTLAGDKIMSLFTGPK